MSYTIRCSNCGYRNPPNHKFCGSCGKSLSSPGQIVTSRPLEGETVHTPSQHSHSEGKLVASAHRPGFLVWRYVGGVVLIIGAIALITAVVFLKTNRESSNGVYISLDPLQSAARAAFQNFATEVGLPYRNDRYEVLTNDGDFATVQVAVEYKVSTNSAWQEYMARTQCSRVGGKWTCGLLSFLSFALSPAEQQRQEANVESMATATALAKTANAASTQIAIEEGIKLIKVVGLTDIVYDDAEGAYYWTVSIQNPTQSQHRVAVLSVWNQAHTDFMGHLNPNEEDNHVDELTIEPNSTQDYKVVAKPYDSHNKIENVRDRATRILAVDGNPIGVDQILGLIGYQASNPRLDNAQLKCDISLTNTDTHEHIVDALFDDTSMVYSHLGDTIRKTFSAEVLGYGVSFNLKPGMTLTDTQTVAWGEYSQSITSANLISAYASKLILRLRDSVYGDFNYSASEKMYITVPIAGCKLP